MSDTTPPPKKNLIERIKEEITAEPARAAMVLGVALVVAVLGALGVQGDLLTRMVRNLPIIVSLAFGFVLLGLTIPFFVPATSERAKRFFGIFAVALVIVGALGTVIVAAYSMSERERPTLAIEPTWSTEVPGSATLAIKASASSLKANEDVMLRVIGIHDSTGQNVFASCSDPHWLHDAAPSYDVLTWSNSGPAVNGLASVSTSLPVSSVQYDYVCALATLRERSKANKDDDRWTVSVLDLRQESTGSNATLPPTTP